MSKSCRVRLHGHPALPNDLAVIYLSQAKLQFERITSVLVRSNGDVDSGQVGAWSYKRLLGGFAGTDWPYRITFGRHWFTKGMFPMCVPNKYDGAGEQKQAGGETDKPQRESLHYGSLLSISLEVMIDAALKRALISRTVAALRMRMNSGMVKMFQEELFTFGREVHRIQSCTSIVHNIKCFVWFWAHR